jgi:co-chaperonin GroES (HSP10)
VATKAAFDHVMPSDRKKKKYKVHPRHGWVIVRKISLESETTEAGLIIDNSQAKCFQAEVVEASHVMLNGKRVASDLEPGDLVIITAFSMTFEDLERLTGEKDLLMVRDEECYARAEEI